MVHCTHCALFLPAKTNYCGLGGNIYCEAQLHAPLNLTVFVLKRLPLLLWTFKEYIAVYKSEEFFALPNDNCPKKRVCKVTCKPANFTQPDDAASQAAPFLELHVSFSEIKLKRAEFLS